MTQAPVVSLDLWDDFSPQIYNIEFWLKRLISFDIDSINNA